MDLIDREATLNALGERPMVWTPDDDYSLGERNQYDIDRLAIETVPSVNAQPEPSQVARDIATIIENEKDMRVIAAQPEKRTETHACDLISRQTAIEICLKYNGVGWVWSQILDELKELPSAVVRCEDCYHYNEEYGQCLLNDSNFKPTDYCSYGSK